MISFLRYFILELMPAPSKLLRALCTLPGRIYRHLYQNRARCYRDWFIPARRRFYKAATIFFVMTFLYTLVLRWVMPPVTFTMIASWWQLEDGKTFSATPVLDRDISAHIKLAAVASEDQKFFEHYGFDFEAIRKAYRRNEKSRRLYGGSTISQQVAKNVFLWQNRSFIRKGLEVYFTILIELLWSKERILEIYLNVAQTGKGVFGAQSAAEVYLKKNSRQLTQSEAALIIASLPNPVNYRINKPSPGMQQRRDFILHKMNVLRADVSPYIR